MPLARRPAEGDSAARPVEHQEEIAEIRAAIGNLSARQRQIVHLVFYERMTIAEAADVLKISVGSARKHYERAKQRLRDTVRGPQTHA